VNSTVQGFKLSLVKSNTANDPNQHIRIFWGTEAWTIDYLTTDNTAANAKQYSRSYRNMVVLRHKASEPTTLYVYYAAPDTSNSNAPNGANLGNAVTAKTLTWDNNSLLNAPLILGGNYVDPSATNPTIENGQNTRKPARGVIYWGKFWNKDLGEKNCNALAAWPHEKIPFYLNGYDNNSTPNR